LGLVLSRLKNVTRCGKGFKARCPAHDDKKASLSICEDSQGNVLLNCFAGCSADFVVKAIDLSLRHLFFQRSTSTTKKDRVFSTEEIRSWPSTKKMYVYRDQDRSPLFLVVRTQDKEFRQYRAVGTNQWMTGLADTKRVLYRLPELLDAVKAGRSIFIVEGEKDVETLVAIGLDATCNPMGAGKWRNEYSESLRGAGAVILPDNDDPGRNHVREVIRSLGEVPKEIRLVELPALPPKGDVSDWLATGKTREDLKRLVSETPPLTKDALEALPKTDAQGQGGAVNQKDGLPDVLARARETWERLVERLKADRKASIEPEVYQALAVLQEHAPADWVEIKRCMQDYRIPQQSLEKAIRAARKGQLRIVAPGETPAPSTAGAMLADAPLPDLVVPDGYFLRESATGYVVETRDGERERRIIAFSPILITGRLYDAEEKVSLLRLEWRRGDGWRRAVVDRGIVLNSRRIVELASSDFPVAGENAKELESYLHRVEAANRTTLPLARVSSHLGWQGKDGGMGFLWGRSLLLPDGQAMTTVDLDEDDPQKWHKDWVTFRGQAAGDDQIVDAYHAKGDLDGWFTAVKVLENYPKALLALYAAFVPPLLPILDAPNFVIDWSCRTSTGKTTALRAAASVWGKPDEKSPDGAITTWDATRVWVERASAMLSGIPLVLDDTKRAKNPKMIAELLYAVASGRGRGRGNIKSLTRTRHWRTVLLSSGEAPVTSFTQDGGTRTRTIEVRGLPFIRADEETGRVVNRLNLAMQATYGVAGPAFVQWLIKNREHWGRYAMEYRDRAAELAAAATSEGGRLAQYAATIDIAATLVHTALRPPWEFRAPVTSLWTDIVSQVSDAAGEERAMQDLYGWACSHETTFYGRHRTAGDGSPLEPNSGWSGRWDRGEGWSFIAFFPRVLEKVLREMGYEPEAILVGWKERNSLNIDEGHGYTTKKCRIPGEKSAPRLVMIRRQGFEGADAC
jgi:hypothetical protein